MLTEFQQETKSGVTGTGHGTMEGGTEEKLTKTAINNRIYLQKELASALWSMSFQNNANQMAIAAEGGVPPLIALLSNARTEVHRDAAGRFGPLVRLQRIKSS